MQQILAKGCMLQILRDSVIAEITNHTTISLSEHGVLSIHITGTFGNLSKKTNHNFQLLNDVYPHAHQYYRQEKTGVSFCLGQGSWEIKALEIVLVFGPGTNEDDISIYGTLKAKCLQMRIKELRGETYKEKLIIGKEYGGRE